MLTEREQLRLSQAGIAFLKQAIVLPIPNALGRMMPEGLCGNYLRSQRSSRRRPYGWFGMWHGVDYLYFKVYEAEVDMEPPFDGIGLQ